MTLLEEAKKLEPREIRNFNFTEEDTELVLSFLNKEISGAAVKKVKGIKPTSGAVFYCYVYRIIKKAIDDNIIVIRKVE